VDGVGAQRHAHKFRRIVGPGHHERSGKPRAFTASRQQPGDRSGRARRGWRRPRSRRAARAGTRRHNRLHIFLVEQHHVARDERHDDLPVVEQQLLGRP
jgi:hypothetical protein